MGDRCAILRVELLQTNRGKAFSLIMGQCEERLVHKMQDDPEWKTVQASVNPLLLFQLIKCTALSQSGETYYPCASALLRLHTLDTFCQGNDLTNGAWYEQFNCQVAIAVAIGVRFIFTSLCEYIAKTDLKSSTTSSPVMKRFWPKTQQKNCFSPMFYPEKWQTVCQAPLRITGQLQ
jgi:hypothetical protein